MTGENDISAAIVRRLSSLFSNTFQIIFLMNGVVLLVSIMSVMSSSVNFHFWVVLAFIAQFWVSIILFFLISVSAKVMLYTIASRTGMIQDTDSILIQSLMMFPLRDDVGDDVMELVMNESMNASQQRQRPAPTMDKLLKMNLDWGFSLRTVDEMTDEEKKDKCLICLQNMEQETTGIQGVVSLSCMCRTLFHKKCILEWFYFNERAADGSEPAQVSCPSCRHVFTLETNI